MLDRPQDWPWSSYSETTADAQRRPPAKPLAESVSLYSDRDQAIAAAYASGGYRLKAIGDHFGLHNARISRIVRAAEEAKGKT